MKKQYLDPIGIKVLLLFGQRSALLIKPGYHFPLFSFQ